MSIDKCGGKYVRLCLGWFKTYCDISYNLYFVLGFIRTFSFIFYQEQSKHIETYVQRPERSISMRNDA